MIFKGNKRTDDAVQTYHEEYTWGTDARFTACIAVVGSVKFYVVYERITNIFAWRQKL